MQRKRNEGVDGTGEVSDAGPRRRLSAAERRAQIIGAARQVFLANGRDGSRTKDIARAAGVNEALLYRHFDSKESLFHEAMVAPLTALVANMAASAEELPFDPAGSRQHELTRSFIAGLLATMIEIVPPLGVVLFAEGMAGAKFYRQGLVPVIDTVTDAVTRALPTFRHRDFEPRFVIEAVVGLCYGLSVDAHFRGREIDVERASADIADLVFYGVSGREPSPTHRA